MEKIRVAQQKLGRVRPEFLAARRRRIAIHNGGLDTCTGRQQRLQRLQLILLQRLDWEQQQGSSRTIGQQVFKNRQEIGQTFPGCGGGDD